MSNGNKGSQKSFKVINEMSKTHSKDEINLKNENLSSILINNTYTTKSKKIEDVSREKNKKINSIVQLYSNSNNPDFKLEPSYSNQNHSLYNTSKNKENINFKNKNTFSYNTLFNKNSANKYYYYNVDRIFLPTYLKKNSRMLFKRLK